MLTFTYTLTLFALVSSALAQIAPKLNTSTAYNLRTQLKPNQTGKQAYENLWLVASHTGAGLNDAVLYPDRVHAINGFTNATNLTTSNGSFFQYQEFDLGNTWPYGLSIASSSRITATSLLALYANSYAAWEPVRINAGYGDGAFTLNATGLQWRNQPNYPEADTGFGGWLVCDWWHGVPQLFVKLSYYHYNTPSSCADVNLIPEYI